jgi:peptidoglycan/LPS O-acetylase OafA/YrhL
MGLRALLPQRRASQFIPALNGLRAIAALSVFTFHAAEEGFLPVVIARADAGGRGVLLFFCLSGLLMAELYLRHDASWTSLWRFIRARFARIFPLFATVVICSALIYHFDHRFPFGLDASGVVKHLLLFGHGATLWSISVEFQFYAIFVGIWLLYAIPPEKYRNFGFTLVCIGLMLVLWIVGYPGKPIKITLYGHFFLAGALAAVILRQAKASNLIGRAANFMLPLLLALYALGSFVLGSSHQESFPLLILTGSIVLAGAVGKGFFAERVLGSQLMVYLGDVSFGLYLLHRPVMYFWRDLVGLHFHWTIMFLTVTATLLAASHLAYRWIEQPARRAIAPDRSAVPQGGALAMGPA